MTAAFWMSMSALWGMARPLWLPRPKLAAEKALKLIQVEYEVLEPVLDLRKAKDNPILIHPEENWQSLSPVGADNHRNLCAAGVEGRGCGSGAGLLRLRCGGTYHTKAVQQSMMEPSGRIPSWIPTDGWSAFPPLRCPSHVRRILANALGIPKSRVRVVKPRIGGGFGAKQTAVCEHVRPCHLEDRPPGQDRLYP